MLASTADPAQFWQIGQNWPCYLARPFHIIFARISRNTFFKSLKPCLSTLGSFFLMPEILSKTASAHCAYFAEDFITTEVTRTVVEGKVAIFLIGCNLSCFPLVLLAWICPQPWLFIRGRQRPQWHLFLTSRGNHPYVWSWSPTKSKKKLIQERPHIP